MRQKRRKTREKTRANKAHGRQTASRPRRRGPSTKAAGGLQAGNKGDGGQTASRQRRPDKKRRTAAGREQGSGTPAEKCRNTGHESPHNSGQPRKNGQPAIWRGTPDKKNPSEQAKFAFALLPARRGLVNRGRQKFASLCLAGTVFCFAFLIFCAFCGAQRRTKRGRCPLLSPAAF